MRNQNNILSDEKGSIIITFAVMLNVLILAIALSMDLGRGFMAKSAISGAADAAAIASAVEEGDADKAKAYFQANLPDGALGIGYDYDQNVQHTIDPVTKDISVNTTGFDIPAFFSRGSGASGAIKVGDSAVVGSAATVVPPADIVIIMDASGSMGFLPRISGSKVTSYNPVTIVDGQQVFKWEALEAGVLSLFDIVFDGGNPVGSDGLPTFRVSLKSYDSGLRGDKPFSGDEATLVSHFPNIVDPGTSTNAGVALNAGRQELANSSAGRRNIYVFLTDGDLNQPKSGPWQWPADYNGQQGNSVAHRYAASECNLIKQDPDVDFWTIGFGASANGVLNKDVLEYCASAPNQYLQPTSGDELRDIFVNIAQQVSRVRIKQ